MAQNKSEPSETTPPDFVALNQKQGAENVEPKSAKRKKRKRQRENGRGVMLLSHIPHGFFEPQMFDFFSQFGRVTRLKLKRSKKTGRSRQFAFIEFEFKEIAEIAAETMNNYIMFQKVLKCKVLPKEDLRKGTFRNWQYKYHVPKTRRKAIAEHNAPVVDPEKIERKKQKTVEKRQKLQKKLTKLGIDYDVLNVKRNEHFVPLARTRATPKDMENLLTKTPVSDERCSDFEYSDEESEKEDELVKEVEAEVEDMAEELSEISDQKPDVIDDNNESSNTVQGTMQKEEETAFDVMVVDLDDSEVTFKSPPAAAKIKRRSIRVAEQEKTTKMTSDDKPADKTVTHRVASKKKRMSKLKKTQELESIDKTEDDTLAEETPKKSLKKRVKKPATEKKPAKKRSKLNKTL